MNFSPRPSTEPIVYPTEVVLGSQSTGRRTLLEKLGIRFRVIVTHVDESHITDADPMKKLQRRAIAKADEIVNNPRVYNLSEVAKTLVIAADTEAILGKKGYGKPEAKKDAREMLKELMDHTHIIATAISIVLMDKGKELKRWNKIETTKVTMNKLSTQELDLYMSRYDVTRFSAAYGITETPWDLISKIDGSYTNVIGLPFEVVLPILKAQEIIVMPKNSLG
jgi:septum formation protein